MDWKNLDLVSTLPEEKRIIAEFRMRNISPDDGKYYQEALIPYLSQEAEWKACAYIQLILLQTRKEMWLASENNCNELEEWYNKFNSLNASLIEKDVTKHDQLAVIEELWRHISEETKALLHPWTTSYDILDTARSYLLKRVYEEQFRPVVSEMINKLIEISEELIKPTEDWKIRALQVWRTHLQNTSPVPFWATLAWYAARLADRLSKCDNSFWELKWKISGIVWTWASVEIVVWHGKSMEFEKKVLEKLWLEPDNTATQVVQKEYLADVWNSLVTLMKVLEDFANDMRMLYSSAIWEVTSRTWAARLWWSSADASKNNPINWENIRWKSAVVESWMTVLYRMITTDFQRDLSNSVQARYQPNLMITEIYESFKRATKALESLSVNEDKMSDNLKSVRENPSEALVAILRWEKWAHSELWIWHDFVKEMAKKSKKEWKNLIDVCLEDQEFKELFEILPEEKKAILKWELELYIWTSLQRAKMNIAYSKWIISKSVSKILKW